MEIYRDGLHSLIDSESFSTLKELPIGIPWSVGCLFQNITDSAFEQCGINKRKIVSPHAEGIIYGLSEKPEVLVTYYSHAIEIIKVTLANIISKAKCANYDTMLALLKNDKLIKEILQDNPDDEEEIIGDLEEICIGIAQDWVLMEYNTMQILDMLEKNSIQTSMNNIAFKIQDHFKLKFSEIYSVEEFNEKVSNSKYYKYFVKELFISHKEVDKSYLTANLEDELLLIFDIRGISEDLVEVKFNKDLYKVYRNIIQDLERAVNLDGLNIRDLETLYVHILANLYGKIENGGRLQDNAINLVKACMIKNIISCREHLGSQLFEKSLVW